jgi:hypothetical protein
VVPHAPLLPNALLSLPLLKASSFLAPSVLSSGFSNVAYSLAYALQTSSSAGFNEALHFVILHVWQPAIPPLTQHSNPLALSMSDRFLTVTSKSKNIFIPEVVPFNLMGVNVSVMHEAANTFDCFCADHLLCQLKQPTIYNATNPFPWMDMISLQGKTNFFEKKVSDYAKTRVIGPTCLLQAPCICSILMNNYKHATSPICYLSMFPKLVSEIMDLVCGSIFVLAILTTRHSICYPGSIKVKTFTSHF